MNKIIKNEMMIEEAISTAELAGAKMTQNEKIIMEFYAFYCLSTIIPEVESQNNLREFILSALKQKDKEWKERIMKAIPERKYLGSVEKNDIWREGFNYCLREIKDNLDL